jgi:adenylate cyclase
MLSGRIARPVAAIARDLAEVGSFRISNRTSPGSFIREIAELGSSVDRMKTSLRSFGHYVPTDVVRNLLAAGRVAELGGEVRRLTLYFSDVADFTAISEGMEPKALVRAVGRYFEIMTTAIARHGGTVDKFMGDGILAFFNAPLDVADHPRKACFAALEAQAALAALRLEAKALGEPAFHARIGLGLGEVIVGNIGTPERFAYTVLGDEVNLASRLETLNKVYGTEIAGTEILRGEAGDGFEWRRLDRVAVRGRRQGTLVLELIGLRGRPEAAVLEARDRYEAGLDAYLAGDFATAVPRFEGALEARPGDRATRVMLDRCRNLQANPPRSWDGVFIMQEK